MNFNRSHSMMVSLNRTSIVKIVLGFAFCLMTMFTLTGILTSLKPEYRISSSSVYSITNSMAESSLVYLLGYENRYFLQAIPEGQQPPQITNTLFQKATSINLDDPRSLLGGELPGFLHFDGELLVAGDGTDYTDIPMESAPPMEVLLAEREAAVQAVENVDKQEDEKPVPPAVTTNGKKVVYLYHTHTRESFLPLLKDVTNPNEAFHSTANITLVGQKLADELEERGIGTEIDKTDFTGVLHKNGWKYGKSYDASRPTVQSAMAANRDIQFLFDLHRDSARKDKTTATINGKAYARLFFVVGGEHAKYEQNSKVADDLHKLIESKYPGLSRGVRLSRGAGTNGKFNQDLSENALIIEFGGVDNTMEELNRSAEAVADIFSEYFWQAEKVNGDADTTEQ
ncbi:stage II sporulation protein P [Bacillus mesophilus]|uniref:Stage II sporulation protein P n=1 Tax=Bacillus mesophilus TaxID=1808955 RepID=A0A6M0Q848_9BACI|nr:stage II sporulation protein P [Bacillus mesophilus]MBM7660773.1 stage II sporulation protein P [Bacillus mesophilus]NEY71680.1 stage II sporulation protein P [Bacillus mesophilus]